MFGIIQANLSDLTEEEKERYRAYYCGLCHALGERYGFWSRLGLTYDLTFLAMFLSSLYEPAEIRKTARCVEHPCKKHDYLSGKYIDYAADMTIALTYFKCLDDWNDDRNISHKCYASLLKKAYEEVRTARTNQCWIIETELNELSEIEKSKLASLDAAANSFGRLMAAVFMAESDHWAPYLQKFGYHIGKYIYLADAAIDLRHDRKKGSYAAQDGVRRNSLEMVNHAGKVLSEAEQALHKVGKQLAKEEKKQIKEDCSALRKLLGKYKPETVTESEMAATRAASDRLEQSSANACRLAG